MAIPFDYIAIIDREQAGNSLYLKSFSRALRNQTHLRGIFIHADNQRTENMIQDGVMRDQARKRVTRETTKRLVDMFAEAGVASVGMQGWQIAAIENERDVVLKVDPREKIPPHTHLVLSNQMDVDGSELDSDVLAMNLSRILTIPTIIKFTITSTDGIFVERSEAKKADIEKAKAKDNSSSVHVLDWGISEWSNAQTLLKS